MNTKSCLDCTGDCRVCESRANHPAGKWDPKEHLAWLTEGAKAEEKDSLFEEFTNVVFTYVEANAELLLAKHRDYGPKNISQSPGGALNGLRVRMHDKLARINNLIDNDRDPENESLRDSFVDLANYATIALLVLDGEWPNE